jgi:hypothetical protein
MRNRARRNNKQIAPAIVVFGSTTNENGKEQTCVYAICTRSDVKVGPIWGHNARSIKRVLATLTEKCDCPARRHSNQEQYAADATIPPETWPSNAGRLGRGWAGRHRLRETAPWRKG